MKRFRTSDGKLSMAIVDIAAATLEEANAYYMDGAQYVTGGRVYTCHRDISAGLVQFTSADGYNIFCDPNRLGTFLPGVADDDLEIVKV